MTGDFRKLLLTEEMDCYEKACAAPISSRHIKHPTQKTLFNCVLYAQYEAVSMDVAS
jgi:hypothetical protein